MSDPNLAVQWLLIVWLSLGAYSIFVGSDCPAAAQALGW